VDPSLEAWLRGRWERRGIPMPEINLKQAWRIPSSEALPNPNGSAPGWFVSRPDGGVAVALPGPPREMRPMWSEEALPRLRKRGLGMQTAVHTFRLTGIGESAVAEILGEEMLRRGDPEVATYARVEAVDVRVSAVGPDSAVHPPVERVEAGAAIVRERLGDHIWAEGDTSWAAAVGARLAHHGWRLAVEEMGTAGQIAVLFGDVGWLALARVRPGDDGPAVDGDEAGLIARATSVRQEAGVHVGLAVRIRARGSEFAVTVAVVTPDGERRQTRATYSVGDMGRHQAALIAAAVLFETLGEDRKGESR
jgi:nicotinamide-nucleotide amidase